jgi:energy-coupling factor transport system ATP-binding protein
VPYAALAARRRLRVVLVALGTTGVLAFVVGGFGLLTNLGMVAAIGAATGVAHRHDRGRGGTVLTAIGLAWVPIALVTNLLLLVFARTRELTLEQIVVSSRGPLRLAENLGLEDVADTVRDAIDWFVDHWWLAIPLIELAVVVVTALVARSVAGPALRRLDATFTRVEESPSEQSRAEQSVAAGANVAPVPVRLENVAVRYPGADVDALHDVDLTIAPGAFVAIVGNNGSGKSTLASLLAGAEPTRGTVTRAGDAGLGRVGGTAVVFQRPESQVLGARVADDVRFGLPLDRAGDAEIEHWLAQVGLAGFGDRDTATLSGGELQRLALASALARRPTLLVSDESTAMLDPEGRALVLAVLLGLPAQGITVVHVTHEPDEAARAETVVVLDAGRVRAVGPPAEVLATRSGPP